MKARPFAFVLASALIAACSGDATLASEGRLIGSWRGQEQPYTVTISGQSRAVQGHVELSFSPNATYRREEVLHDPVLNRDFVERAEEGTYSTRGTLLDLKLTALYRRNGGEPQVAPALEPFEGEGLFGFQVDAKELTVNWCPMGSYCPRDFTTHHTRVATGSVAR